MRSRHGRGYSDRLLHGEAIAIGMCLAFRFSAALGYCTEAAADRAAAHFRAVGLPTRIAEIPGDKPDVEAMMRLMAQDKKVRQGKLTFILVRDVGEAFIARDVPAEQGARLSWRRDRRRLRRALTIGIHLVC